MGQLLFTQEGDVFRFRDEDILLPEQVWQPPRFESVDGDPGIVTFVVIDPSSEGGERRTVQAHGFMLGRYEYFRRLLSGWAEGQSREVIVEDVELSTLKGLFQYIYAGEIDRNISLSGLTSLLRAANKYLMADLTVAALRRLQRALSTPDMVSAAGGAALAEVLATAEEVGSDGAALLQDAAEAVLIHRPQLLEDEAFLVPLARRSPGALCGVLAAFRACSALDRAKVRWKRECGSLGRGVRPLWLGREADASDADLCQEIGGGILHMQSQGWPDNEEGRSPNSAGVAWDPDFIPPPLSATGHSASGQTPRIPLG